MLNKIGDDGIERQLGDRFDSSPGPNAVLTESDMVIYECGICDCYHPWDWNGDCRDDENRFGSPEEFAHARGISEGDVGVRSMADRVKADL